MKVSGSYELPVDQARAHMLLQDPVALARAMPGCDRLERIGEDEYAMKMKMIIASLSGLFDSKVRLVDHDPPHSFGMQVDGNGKIGFVKGAGVIRFQPNAAGTVVHYEGEVHVGGTIAAVGQRLIDSTAKMMIRKFFERMAETANGQ